MNRHWISTGWITEDSVGLGLLELQQFIENDLTENHNLSFEIYVFDYNVVISFT